MPQRELIALRADRGVHLDENGRIALWENQAMAFTIKPEDISDEFVKSRIDDPFVFGIRENMAEFLNRAIEAGLVSPPCHVIKHDDGYVKDPGYERRIRVWPGKGDGPNCEHYWGQE